MAEGSPGDACLICHSVDLEETTTSAASVDRGLYTCLMISTSSGFPRSCQKAVEALLAVCLIRSTADPSDAWEFARDMGNEAVMMIVNVDSTKLESTKTNPIAKRVMSESHQYKVRAEGECLQANVVLLFGI